MTRPGPTGSLRADRPRTPEDSLRPLRIGLVGFGRVVRRYYVPALRHLPGIHAIAVADPLERAHGVARASLPNATTCGALPALFEQRPDALLVASPPSTHLEIWNDACTAGVPVFMEKPFVLSHQLADAHRSPEARRLLMVNFNRRFWPVYQEVRALVRSGAVGALESAEFALHLDLVAWCEVTSHRLTPGEGGVLHDLGSQALDLVSWLLPGDPVTVEAEIASRRWPGDHVRLALRFEGGFTVSCDLAYDDRTYERVVIRGSGGRIRLDDPNMVMHLERAGAPGSRLVARGRDLLVLGYRAIRRARSMARYSIEAALGAFLDAVRREAPFSPGFDEGARNVTWLDAASRALASGAPVALPRAGPGSP